MADIIDLSSLADVYDGLPEETQEELADMADNEYTNPPEGGVQVRTAFLVVVDSNGEVFASGDLDLSLQRAFIPSADDIYGACANVQRDINVQMSAQHTMLGMQKMAVATQQQMAEAQLRQRLNLK